MSSFWLQQQIGISIFLTVILIIALSNWWALRRLGQDPPPSRWPRVSALVPARNEEANIGPCVGSLLAQHYPDFQVLVLDDDSTDGTSDLVASLAGRDLRLTVLRGQPLPAGWLGKHWACHQLAQAADGELLLFTDADTRHHPDTMRDAVAALNATGADLLSAVPHEEVCTWAERLLVPIIPWALFSFLPLVLAHRLRLPALSAAIGQFMLFRRQAYEQVGGHAAVRRHGADDLALGRRVKAQGLRLRLVDGGRRISCRMYRTTSQVFEGLGKNLFAAFDYHAPAFIFVWLWLALVFCQPWVMLVLAVLGAPLPAASVWLAFGSMVASLFLWAMTYHRFGFPRYLAPLYPVTILLIASLAFHSMFLARTGRAKWKGRTLLAPIENDRRIEQ